MKEQVYYRLIALWVLFEAMLGGIIHGLRIPVSGLVVGSAAVICISLIGYYVGQRGAILKATLIVAIFKMMLSPQSPPPAYIAVFFQGLMGELLFFNKRYHRTSCMLLAILALLESALQRILVLTIVYGNDLWIAVNDFINRLTGQREATNYSLFIAGAYVSIHLVAGILVGWWAGVLPTKINTWEGREVNFDHYGETLPVKKRKRLKKGLLIVWVVLILLYAQSYFAIGKPLLTLDLPLRILIRSAIVVLTWYFLAKPFFAWILRQWLDKKKSRFAPDIAAIAELIPGFRKLMTTAWQTSATQKGIKRLIEFGKIILVNVLKPKHA
jgi:ABC-type thiamin/hydroxymethylpyrimidine transport system permease subunit